MKPTLILLAAILCLSLNADIVGDVYVSDMAGRDRLVFGYGNRTNKPPEKQRPMYFGYKIKPEEWSISVETNGIIKIEGNHTNTIFVGTNAFRIKHTLVTNVTDVVTFERIESK